MSKFKFNKEDVYVNRTKTYPDYKIFVNDANVTINNDVVTNASTAVSAGYQTLYEYNFDTRFDYIHPFIIDGENATRQVFRSMVPSSGSVIYNSQNPNWAQYANLLPGNGQNITSSYLAMTSSLERITTVSSSNYIHAIRNVSRNYYLYSTAFKLTSSLQDSTMTMINIPQLFFGSAIKKGSVELNFYVTGTLIARARDEAQNGELKQTGDGITSTGSGSVVGLVYYDHGFMLLTSSAALYTSSSLNRWLDFGTGLHDGTSSGAGLEDRSFEIKYKGTSYVNTMTMFCHAKAGDLNLSNNPTSLDYSTETKFTLSDTGSTKGFEERQKSIKNVVSSSFENLNDDFKKTTYISKINMYDDKGNLIGVASLAQPIRKEENNGYTFKIELDT